MALVPTPPVPTVDPRPWYMGKGTGGATAFTAHEIRIRARALLESEDYQTQLKIRIKTGTLPPAVETMIWHYAYGKPVEQVSVTVSPGERDLSNLSLEDLLNEAKAVEEQIAEARAVQEALPVEYKVTE